MVADHADVEGPGALRVQDPPARNRLSSKQGGPQSGPGTLGHECREDRHGVARKAGDRWTVPRLGGEYGARWKKRIGGPNTHLHIFWARRDPINNEAGPSIPMESMRSRRATRQASQGPSRRRARAIRWPGRAASRSISDLQCQANRPRSLAIELWSQTISRSRSLKQRHCSRSCRRWRERWWDWRSCLGFAEASCLPVAGETSTTWSEVDSA